MYIYICDASEFIIKSLRMKYPAITAQQGYRVNVTQVSLEARLHSPHHCKGPR